MVLLSDIIGKELYLRLKYTDIVIWNKHIQSYSIQGRDPFSVGSKTAKLRWSILLKKTEEPGDFGLKC